MSGAKKRQILYGVATYLPGVNAIFGRGGGDSKSARYCYSVWLRHLVTAFEAGLAEHPRVVAELGPGDTLGVGLAALISGAEKYNAFDVVRHADVAHNQKIFDELVELFRRREPIPHGGDLVEVRPLLGSYAFPHAILTDAHLARVLAPERLKQLRAALQNEAVVQYRTRWFDDQQIDRESVDLVCSQAVLEHVDDLDSAYRAMRQWLKPGGVSSHQIDFRCHNTARGWNGHWTIPDTTWKVLRGKRSYLLNREPCSTHVRLLKEHGFELTNSIPVEMPSEVSRSALAPRFDKLTDDDLKTCGALLQAVKR
jgi:SAM-dependent methyltransferase